MTTAVAPRRTKGLWRQQTNFGTEFYTNLSWGEYQSFMKDVGESPLRFTYDRGMLEIMPSSPEHEMYSRLIAHFVTIMAGACSVPLWFGGSTTFERRDLDRGLQPDECYWTRNLSRVRGKKRFDFRRDPPPDLFIEIEISRTILDRIELLSALGVREIWRFNGKTLLVGVLRRDGEYEWVNQSPIFPEIPIKGIARFLRKALTTKDHPSLVWEFQEWVREQL